MLLLLGIAGRDGVLQVHGQVDNLGEATYKLATFHGITFTNIAICNCLFLRPRVGFINLDCGLPESAAGYVDGVTKLRFTSDAGFIDAGTNHNMSSEYITPSMGRSWHNVRSFGGGTGARSCYTLRSLVAGLKYLIRAKFLYGNYDGLDRAPVFHLHVGVNYWTTVNISNANTPVIYEIIAAVPGESVHVCLVNTGSGTPFISSLDLRPLKNGLYPMANATQGLVLLTRSNFGRDDGVILSPQVPRRPARPFLDPNEQADGMDGDLDGQEGAEHRRRQLRRAVRRDADRHHPRQLLPPRLVQLGRRAQRQQPGSRVHLHPALL